MDRPPIRHPEASNVAVLKEALKLAEDRGSDTVIAGLKELLVEAELAAVERDRVVAEEKARARAAALAGHLRATKIRFGGEIAKRAEALEDSLQQDDAAEVQERTKLLLEYRGWIGSPVEDMLYELLQKE